jgi:peptide chain release factor 2
MDNPQKIIEELKTKLADLEAVLKLSTKRELIIKNKAEQSTPDFWNDREKAVAIGQETERLSSEVAPFDKMNLDLKETEDILSLAEQEKEEDLLVELDNKIAELQAEFANLEFYSLLSGEYDNGPAILSIHAGTGGVDAQDFAQMLERMYLRFIEKQNWQVEILEHTIANEAGIKSMMMRVSGAFAYGFLQSENGVHRLVRISPFDGESLRQTSFALVEVIPELPDSAGITVRDEDLRVDLFRSSGPGGQNVNKTESAIRITHLPTGIVVSCQTERSQHQNREIAMKILYAKLYQLALEERSGEMQKIKGATQMAAWGRQIRSYVMQPYQMVKDHRTDYETSDVSGVFDGELKPFMEEYLRFKKGKEKV